MIISHRSAAAVSYTADPVAQSVRNFVAPSARLESRSEAAPGAATELDLVRFYPAIFGDVTQPSHIVRSVRATSGALSGMAAAVAALAAVFHH